MAGERMQGKAGDKAADKTGDKIGAGEPAPSRYVYGPRQVGALLPALVRPAFRNRAPATAQVLADWEAIVGPALASTTTPRRLSSGTLAIACAGPVAMELQHLSEQLMARINGHLGRVVVSRLRFVQDVPPALPAARPPRPQAVAAARLAVAGLPEGELRDALESLGRVVLTERPR
jgi:hypothetical protein